MSSNCSLLVRPHSCWFDAWIGLNNTIVSGHICKSDVYFTLDWWQYHPRSLGLTQDHFTKLWLVNQSSTRFLLVEKVVQWPLQRTDYQDTNMMLTIMIDARTSVLQFLWVLQFQQQNVGPDWQLSACSFLSSAKITQWFKLKVFFVIDNEFISPSGF